MTPNTVPIFIKQGNTKPTASTMRIAAANTASDGSGTLVPILTSGVDGTRVDGIRFRNSQVTAAASSNMVHRIFLSDTAGSNFRIVGEIVTAAATRSTTVVGATSIYTFDSPLLMVSGSTLSVAQSVYAGAQDQFDVCPFAGDY